jgi:hypothetical protein
MLLLTVEGAHLRKIQVNKGTKPDEGSGAPPLGNGDSKDCPMPLGCALPNFAGAK